MKEKLTNEKIYQSKIIINTYKQPSVLKKEIQIFVNENSNIHCKALKRKVQLLRMPEAIARRGSSSSKRLRCFMAAADIIKNARYSENRENKGFLEYAIKGISANGYEVEVHIREEISASKDRELFMVSCFYK